MRGSVAREIVFTRRIGEFALGAGHGKSAIRGALTQHDPKRLATPTVSRTLHTYHNAIRILCQAFEIDFEGGDFKVERQLIDQAFTLHRRGKSLAVLIDDAHLMPMDNRANP